jgi:hypothetical protein
MFNLGFAVFTVFSILLSVTWMHGSAGALWLILMRVGQGVGGAPIFASPTCRRRLGILRIGPRWTRHEHGGAGAQLPDPRRRRARRRHDANDPLLRGARDLLLVTHEHADHNAVEVVGGSPQILRSTAGTFDSPVGIGGESAAAIVRALRPRLVVPMHYRTEAVNFLDPPDEFLDARVARVERVDERELEAERVLATAEDPTVAPLAPPKR